MRMISRLMQKLLQAIKHNRLWKHSARVLACLVVFATTYALILPAITLEHTAHCGLEEHRHTEACYTRELVCDQEESEEHEHTDACYADVLACELPEHEHGLQCWSDPQADVETSDQWEQTLPKGAALSGTRAENLAAVAESQVRYTESEKNYLLGADGVTKRGYTRYGAFYASLFAQNQTEYEAYAYGDWSGAFVTFCMYYAGTERDALPRAYSVADWQRALRSDGLLYDPAEREIAIGDLVLLHEDNPAPGAPADQLGIVTERKCNSSDELTGLVLIVGDEENKVAHVELKPDAKRIAGFAALPENDVLSERPVAEIAPTIAQNPESEDSKGLTFTAQIDLTSR